MSEPLGTLSAVDEAAKENRDHDDLPEQGEGSVTTADKEQVKFGDSAARQPSIASSDNDDGASVSGDPDASTGDASDNAVPSGDTKRKRA